MFTLHAVNSLKCKTGGSVRSSASVSNGIMFMVSSSEKLWGTGTSTPGDGLLYAVNASTGALLWKIKTADPKVLGSLSVDKEGTVRKNGRKKERKKERNLKRKQERNKEKQNKDTKLTNKERKKEKQERKN
jgi:hypothetical protein